MPVKWDRTADPETFDIIGAAIAAHRELGPGFLEAAYARAMELELGERQVPFQREVALPILYRGKPLGVPFRVDFLCHGHVLVELKALPQLGPAERRQLIHYVKAAGASRGLLLNFGGEVLQIERAVGTVGTWKVSLDSVLSHEAQGPAAVTGTSSVPAQA